MDSSKGSIASASSRNSPRLTSTRVATVRGQGKDQRDVLHRIQRGSSILAAAAASQHQFSKAPIPAALKGSDCRRRYTGNNAGDKNVQLTSWSLQHGDKLPALNIGLYDLTLTSFVRDPLAWLSCLLYRLQSKLSQLLRTENALSAITSFNSASSAISQAGRSMTNAARALSSTAANATSAPTRRCSSGRFVPASATPAEDASLRMSITRLMPASPFPSLSVQQRPSVPLATLALGTAAALTVAGFWLFRRCQLMLVEQREQAQRAAAKKDHLSRQKQRFQRALVVDSVNLPPIKDMDVQPGQVRAEQILSPPVPAQQRTSVSGATQQREQRNSPWPGLAGDNLQKWNQFMSASRAKEVISVPTSKQRGVGGGRAPARSAYDSDPYRSMDDRTLTELSERIRRADENAAAAPPPLITFEQLYANNTETDEDAMARRAAERKARWQKQQPTGNAPEQRSPGARAPPSTTSQAPPRAGSRVGSADKPLVPSTFGAGVAGSTSAPHRVASRSLDKQDGMQGASSAPRPRLVSPGNPFAVGLFPASDTSSSSNLGQSSSTTVMASSSQPRAREQLRPDLDSARTDVGGSGSGRAVGLAPRARALQGSAQESTSSVALGASGASAAAPIASGPGPAACIQVDKSSHSIVRYKAAPGSVPTSRNMEVRASTGPVGITECTHSSNASSDGTAGSALASGSLPATEHLAGNGPIDATLHNDGSRASTSGASTIMDGLEGLGTISMLEADGEAISASTPQLASAPADQATENAAINQVDAFGDPSITGTDASNTMLHEAHTSASGTSACEGHRPLCLIDTADPYTLAESSSQVGSLAADVHLCMEADRDLERVTASTATKPESSVASESWLVPSPCATGPEQLVTAAQEQLEEAPDNVSRGKRARATGQLRKPETLAPELARLMRRPSASP